MDPEAMDTLPPEPETGEEQHDGEAVQTWSYRDVGFVMVFALVAQALLYLFGLLAALLLQQAGGSRLPPVETLMRHVGFLLPMQLAWWAAVCWLVYRVVRARDPRPFGIAIGWVRPSWPLPMYVAGGILLALSVAGLSFLFPLPRQKSPIEQLLMDPSSAFLMAGFGVLIAPVAEEVVFRGFLFPVLDRAHGVLVAVAGTAALFSVLHAPQYGWAWQNLLLLTYVGVVFGTLRGATGSVVPSTLVHAAYNLTLFVGLYASSSGFRNL